jgi:hypothetical protein
MEPLSVADWMMMVEWVETLLAGILATIPCFSCWAKPSTPNLQRSDGFDRVMREYCQSSNGIGHKDEVDKLVIKL